MCPLQCQSHFSTLRRCSSSGVSCLQACTRLSRLANASAHTTCGGYSGRQVSLSSMKRWFAGSFSAALRSLRSASTCRARATFRPPRHPENAAHCEHSRAQTELEAFLHMGWAQRLSGRPSHCHGHCILELISFFRNLPRSTAPIALRHGRQLHDRRRCCRLDMQSLALDASRC